jgi:sugar phosphate permease
VYSSNTLITSLFPMEMKGKINSGLIAGVLNGFCYVGSTLSTYGLGAIADAFTDKEAKYYGWNEVFWTIFAICIVVSAAAVVYACIRRAMTVKNNAKEAAQDNTEA